MLAPLRAPDLGLHIARLFLRGGGQGSEGGRERVAAPGASIPKSHLDNIQRTLYSILQVLHTTFSNSASVETICIYIYIYIYI